MESKGRQYLKEPQTGGVTDVRALSDTEVTPFGCQRANRDFWRESLQLFVSEHGHLHR